MGAKQGKKNSTTTEQLKNRITKAVFSAAESTGLPDREIVEQMIDQVLERLDWLEPTPGILPGWEDLAPQKATNTRVTEMELRSKVKEVLDNGTFITDEQISTKRLPRIPRKLEDIKFDVAISFAGTERVLAMRLASLIREAGFLVFYDAFYIEDLWGKNLYSLFDSIFRDRSRYCVILVSSEYCIREWPNHEFRSALARTLKERGKEYILPIKIDDTELPELNPMIGYISLEEFSIDEIAGMLINKLKRNQQG